MRRCSTAHGRASSSHIVYKLSLKQASSRGLSCTLVCLTLYNPDLIIVLKDGGVVEQGTHEELILARGLYYSLWQEQAADTFSETSPAVVE